MRVKECTLCLEPIKAEAKAGKDYAYQAGMVLVCKACVREIYGVRLADVVR